MRRVKPVKQGFTKYLFTDENTGKEKFITIEDSFIDSIRALLPTVTGFANAKSTADLLESLGKKDTDQNRRKFRAVCAMLRDREDYFICAAQEGVYIALSVDEAEKSATSKVEKAERLLASARSIRARASRLFAVAA